MNITNINSLIEALESNTPLNQIFISDQMKGNKLQKVKLLCKKRKIIYRFIPKVAIDKKSGGENQGVFTQISPVKFLTFDNLIATATRGLIVILSNIFDPHNIGAIIRSCVGAGVDGIVISQKNTAPINETVLRVSAGTLLKARIALSKQITNDINILKKNGYWIVGAEMEQNTLYYDYDFSEKTAIVMGNESKGISPNLKKLIDQPISIPISNDLESLNVSVACGIILFEADRQKRLFHNSQNIRP